MTIQLSPRSSRNGRAVALGFVAAIAVAAFLARDLANESAARAFHPVWTEANWPFPMDPWGKGTAFRCKAADCGSEVQLYVRAKLGFCNCVSGIADDTDLEQMGDLAMIGGEVEPLGVGRQIKVGSMHGRSRVYGVRGTQNRHGSAISLAFNERCDMVAALALLQREDATSIEPVALDFLNSETVLKWIETTLGL
jgi:hypothetical protein